MLILNHNEPDKVATAICAKNVENLKPTGATLLFLLSAHGNDEKIWSTSRKYKSSWRDSINVSKRAQPLLPYSPGPRWLLDPNLNGCCGCPFCTIICSSTSNNHLLRWTRTGWHGAARNHELSVCDSSPFYTIIRLLIEWSYLRFLVNPIEPSFPQNKEVISYGEQTKSCQFNFLKLQNHLPQSNLEPWKHVPIILIQHDLGSE